MALKQPEVPDPLNPAPPSSLAAQLRNLLIVIAATVLSLGLFLGFQTQSQQVSLPELAKTSIPLETALSNGKPTLMEFYANWCTTCQTMAPDLAQLKQQFGGELNFVMLNVDNSKWLPEILRYRVDGIPHFVFLNPAGEELASAIGLQPHAVMASNLTALVAGESLPHLQTASGQTSNFSAAVKPNADDPRSHGGVPPG